jgi:hypothetical protein
VSKKKRKEKKHPQMFISIYTYHPSIGEMRLDIYLGPGQDGGKAGSKFSTAVNKFLTDIGQLLQLPGFGLV